MSVFVCVSVLVALYVCEAVCVSLSVCGFVWEFLTVCVLDLGVSVCVSSIVYACSRTPYNYLTMIPHIIPMS